MKLREREQKMLRGEQGPQMQKMMKTLVMYGACFGAEEMAPVNSAMGHLVTSFGLKVMSPVYELLDELLAAGIHSAQPFSVDPRPMDPNIPQSPLQRLVFRMMYGKQAEYEEQLAALGLAGSDRFTCACYLDEVGNTPRLGEVLSWAESSAVVYANSVLGARCNRNSGIIELFGSITGCVPRFGLLTDEGRKATYLIEVDTKELPEAQLLGSAIGKKVVEEVPYIRGLDRHLGQEMTGRVRDYLKDLGAAAASNGAVGLFHVENLTPEAKRVGETLLTENPKRYRIDEAVLSATLSAYPVLWGRLEAQPRLCFIGCPHLSLDQLTLWAQRVAEKGVARLRIPTVFTTAPAVKEIFLKTDAGRDLVDKGGILSSICPLMYMNNPLCAKQPVITCSNKLRTYSTARFYPEQAILEAITGGTL
ncbi:hypothetical protein ABB02_01786 [Clostridiaceae bacterium JG1575]|nr:hypothetical protein ABB02_01786 [Clostridiaceae bacterium JG1575]